MPQCLGAHVCRSNSKEVNMKAGTVIKGAFQLIEVHYIYTGTWSHGRRQLSKFSAIIYYFFKYFM